MHTRFLLHHLRALFTKKKRVRQLGQARITLGSDAIDHGAQNSNKINYMQMRQILDGLAWENMNFDKLCNLPSNVMGAIELEIKKDKFNVDDRYFEKYSSQLWEQENSASNLSAYYSRMLALLKNDHHSYDQIQPSTEPTQGFLGHLYVQDLTKDKQLKAVLTQFINNLQHPSKLESVTEPTFIKKLLTIKRELMMQGIKFQSLEQRKKSKKQLKKLQSRVSPKEQKSFQQQKQINEEVEEQMDNDSEDQEFLQVEQELKLTQKMNKLMETMLSYENQLQIQKVLKYEHEFWVDVKHNRAKNGSEEDYTISLRNIPNPNETLLLTSQHPTLPVKYIVRKDKHRQYPMHFCSKADLLIKVNGKHLRRIKVEWNGPANKQDVEVMDYRVIDYENLMNGNPTIRSIFSF